MKLASRGKRLGAGLIDMIVPFIAYIVLISIYGAEAVLPGGGYGYGNSFGYGYDLDYGYNYDMPVSKDNIAMILVLLVIMIAYIIAELVLYARAQSIGKAILGLQVVSSNNGKPFTFWKMMLRECIVKSASGGTFMLGYIWILIDERNRGWHDKILDSYVVDLKETANMYYRAATQAQPIAPVHKEENEKQQADAAPQPVVEEIKAEVPHPEVHEISTTVEALEAPDKVEALDAPEKVEALDAPTKVEESITAAGDEQTEISVKEDDTEIK
jgi:uncharacterized RDD family membrane protein YckC